MVAVVAGKGLGLINSSAYTLGNQGELGSSGVGKGNDDVYVNASNGNLVITDQDEILTGFGGIDNVLSRTYNSQGALDDDNGDNWKEGAVRSIAVTGTLLSAGSSITLTEWDGSKTLYAWGGSGAYNMYYSTDGGGAQNWIYTNGTICIAGDGSTQAQAWYDSAGKLYKSYSGAGLKTDYSYNGSGLLSQVTYASGEYVTFTYSGSNLTQVDSHYNANSSYYTRTRYGYDGSNRLSTVTVDKTPSDNSISDGATYVTTYTYDGSSRRVASISQTDGTYLAISYTLVGSDYRVSSLTQTMASGVTRTTSLSYNTAARMTLVTDPAGVTKAMTYDSLGQLTQVFDAPPATALMTASTSNAILYQGGGGWSDISATAGDVVVFTITLQGVGSVTSDTVGIYGTNYGGGSNAYSSAVIVSGSGSLTRGSGSSWVVSGLSTSSSTTIQITRTMEHTEAVTGTVRVGGGSFSTGDSVLVSGPSFTVNGGANLWHHPENPAYWTTDYATLTPTDTILDTALITTETVPSGYSPYLYQGGGGWSDISVVPGDVVVFTITLQGVGSVTSDMVAVYGTGLGFGNNADSSATILTGSGSLTRNGGSSWNVTGLSTSSSTTIRITRTMAYTEGVTGILREGGASFATGDSVLVSSPSFTVNGGANLWHHPEDSSYWSVFYANVNPAGANAWRYAYDAAGNVIAATDPLGNVTVYQYDSQANCTLQRDAAGNTITRTFDSTNQMLSATTYLTPDPDGAGSGTASDPQTTRYVYSAPGEVAYRISPEGKVSYDYHSYGLLISTVEFSADLYTTSGNPSYATMTSWASGKATSNEIDYTYDWRGNLASSTPAGTSNHTYYTYDPSGRLLTLQAPSGATTTYVYDGLGRQISVTNPASSATTTAYNDASGTTVVTLANGATQTLSYNLGGQVTSSAAAGSGVTTQTTTFTYDLDGRVASATDAGSHTSYTLFDTLGRKTADVDATGAVTEYKYNADNQVIATVRYATLYTSSIAAGTRVAAIRPSASANDVWAWSIYDSTGRLAETVDGLGGVTTFAYDGASQLIKTTVWKNDLSASLSTYKTTPPTSVTTPSTNSADRISRFFYGSDGELVGTLDPLGALSESVYDNLGQKIETIAYATQTNSSYWASGSFSTLKTSAGASSDDVHNWFLYNAQGQLGATIDGEGAITRYTYESNGNVTQKAEGQVGSVSTFIATRPTLGTLPSGTALKTTTYSYTSLGQLYQTTSDSYYSTTTGSSFAPVSTNVYDAMGNLSKVTDPAGAQTFFYYDKLNRQIEQVDALGYVTTWAYDTIGNVTSAKAYATAVSLPGSPGGSPPSPSGAYRETTFTYDADNRVLTSNVAGVTTGEWNGSSFATSTATMTTTNAYDALGRLVSTTDARGNAAYVFYDTLNRVVATVDAEKFLTYNTYNALGDLTKVERFATAVSSVSTSSDPTTLASGVRGSGPDRVCDYTYDNRGQMLTQAEAGLVQTAINTSTGAMTTTTAASTVTNTYNTLGQVSRTAQATGDYSDFTYDRAGRLASTVASAFTDYASSSVRSANYTTYNGLGEVLTTTVRAASGTSSNDQTTTFTYATGGWLTQTSDANAAATLYYYDGAGRRTYATYIRHYSNLSSGDNDASVTGYDLLGRVTGQYQAVWGGSSWVASDTQSFTYDAYGEVTATALNSVTQQTMSYDDAGRLWKQVDDGVSTAYLYDKTGNVSLTVNSSGTDFSSSSLSTILSTLTGSGGHTIGAAATSGMVATISVRDKRGLETSTRLPYRELTSSTTSSLTQSRTYNAFGQVSQSTDTLSGVTDYTYDYTYNVLGEVTKVQSPTVSWTAENGTQTSARPTVETFYDASGRMVGTEDADAHVAGSAYYTTRLLLAGTGYGGGQALTTKEFHPDGGSKSVGYDVYHALRKTTDEVGDVVTYDHDKLNQTTSMVHSAITDSYFYDEIGERVRHTNSQLGSSYVERTDYDLQGRVIAAFDFEGRETDYSYVWSGSLATWGIGYFGGWTKTTTRPEINSSTNIHRTEVELTDAAGRTLQTTDMSGNATYYTYDYSGSLVLKSGGSQNVTNTYFNTGRVASVTDTGTSGYGIDTNVQSLYGYDAAGRLIAETRTANYGTGSAKSLQNETIDYDALGRMTRTQDSGLNAALPIDLTQEYDLAGNIRRTATTYTSITTGSLTTEDDWYRYDSLGRMTTAKGTFTGSRGSGSIAFGSNGEDIYYNAASQRVAKISNLSGGQVESYGYTADGYLATIRQASGTSSGSIGSGTTVGTDTYDAMGRMTGQTTATTSRTLTYDRSGLLLTDTTATSGADTTQVAYSYVDGSSRYQGVATTVTNTDTTTSTLLSTTTKSYLWRDSALLSSSVTDGVTSAYHYDAGGNLAKVEVSGTGVTAYGVLYINNEQGEVMDRLHVAGGTSFDSYTVSQWLTKIAGDPLAGKQANYYIAGKTIGQQSNDGQAGNLNFGATATVGTLNTAWADFDQAYSAIDANNSGLGGQSYVVRDGDTLTSIAQSLWGDAALWYLIGEANGISQSDAIAAGQVLTIPAKVTNMHHSAGTFRPYDPNSTFGDLRPDYISSGISIPDFSWLDSNSLGIGDSSCVHAIGLDWGSGTRDGSFTTDKPSTADSMDSAKVGLKSFYDMLARGGGGVTPGELGYHPPTDPVQQAKNQQQAAVSVAAQVATTGQHPASWKSLFTKVSNALHVAGDVLGFDGQFGYQGPEGVLSLAGLATALDGWNLTGAKARPPGYVEHHDLPPPPLRPGTFSSGGSNFTMTSDTVATPDGRYYRKTGPNDLTVINMLDKGEAHDAPAPWEIVGPGDVAGIARLGLKALARVGVEEIAESGVWKLNPFKRGQQIEQALGHNLPSNFPVIDRFENGLATSIKSLDLDAATYQSSATLNRTLTGYVDKVAGFQGRTWAGVRISSQDISGRALDLAIPHSGSAAQQAIINQTVKYGASRGVTVNVITYP